MIIVGGRSGDGPSTTLSDSWSLSLSGGYQWTRLSGGPSQTFKIEDFCDPLKWAFMPRTHATAALLSGQLILFGGITQLGGFGMQDTWAHSLTSPYGWGWLSGETSISGGCSGMPERRYYHTAIVDSYNRMTVFGGIYEDQPVSNGWITSDGSSWGSLGEAPEGYSRKRHTAVWDPIGSRMLVLGGYDPVTEAIQSAVTSIGLPQVLPPTAWSTLTPSGTGPGNIAEHAAVYDPVHDWMIVFGGVGSSGFLAPDVHVLDFINSDVTAPAVATLSGFAGKTNAAINWDAPGDDGAVGTACKYLLKRSSSPITEGNFLYAQTIAFTNPQPAGSPECVTSGGLSPCQIYYYALKTWDEAGNLSPLSNVLALTQNCSGNEVICGNGPVSLIPTPEMPATLEYALGSGNPTSGSALFNYGVPPDLAGQSLEISVFDVAGRRVQVLEKGTAKAGRSSATWDLRTADGRQVSVGVYFARLQVGSETRTHKIVVGPAR